MDYYDNQIDYHVKSSKELKSGQEADSQKAIQRISMSSDRVLECQFNNDSIIKAHRLQNEVKTAEVSDQQERSRSRKSNSGSDNESYDSFAKDAKSSKYNRNDPATNRSESDMNCESGRNHQKARSTLKRYKSKAK